MDCVAAGTKDATGVRLLMSCVVGEYMTGPSRSMSSFDFICLAFKTSHFLQGRITALGARGRTVDTSTRGAIQSLLLRGL